MENTLIQEAKQVKADKIRKLSSCMHSVSILLHLTKIKQLHIVTMTRKEKLLEKARRNPKGLRFDDFQKLMRQCEWVLDHQSGSHQIWYSKKGKRISVQDRKGMAKGYQVKQFLLAHDGEKRW